MKSQNQFNLRVFTVTRGTHFSSPILDSLHVDMQLVRSLKGLLSQPPYLFLRFIACNTTDRFGWSRISQRQKNPIDIFHTELKLKLNRL